MADRLELIEATLDGHPDGVALLGMECRVVLWNQAAEAITGHAGPDLIGRPAPEGLQSLFQWCDQPGQAPTGPFPQPGRGCLLHIHHRLGHELPVFARIMVLRDGLGKRIGTAIVFHPAESLDALPHGELSEEGISLEASQADFEDRLGALFEDFTNGGLPFGVLWVTVDQAHELRKTHGTSACNAMLETVERSLARGLRPGEELRRWGEDEFLILSHERTAEMLANHAQLLAGLARTADFRWWGDRASLTVSIGAAQADLTGTLAALLERAKAAMFSSFHAGGNRITAAPGDKSCLPS
jgi:diguanylate cyclase (GGDEF)-like protein